MSILLTINKQILNNAKLNENQHIVDIFNIRYKSGSKDVSKFSSIGEQVGKSGQTVRSTIIRTWGLIEGRAEIIDKLSAVISKVMRNNKSTSVEYGELLAGDDAGVFSGMSAKDVSCLIHDVIAYMPTSSSRLFIVRKHGKSKVSVMDSVDSIKKEKERPNHEEVAITEEMIRGVSGILKNPKSLAVDVFQASNLLTAKNAKILNERCGLTTKKARTLSQVGSVFKVTRERIRQTTGIAIRLLQAAEKSVGSGPLIKLKSIANSVNFKENKTVSLASIIAQEPYLSDFENNEHGLFLLLSLSGVNNVIQSTGFYLYDPSFSSDHALHEVTKAKSGANRVNITEKKHQMMAVLPSKVKAAISKKAKLEGKSVNAYYDFILQEAVEKSLTYVDADVLIKSIGPISTHTAKSLIRATAQAFVYQRDIGKVKGNILELKKGLSLSSMHTLMNSIDTPTHVVSAIKEYLSTLSEYNYVSETQVESVYELHSKCQHEAEKEINDAYDVFAMEEITWSEVGKSWDMINMRLPKSLIDSVTELAENTIVDGKKTARTTLVFNLIKSKVS